MNKPITMIVDELKQKLVATINDAKLPLFIIEYVLRDFVQEIHVGSLQQLESDKQRYAQYLKELASKEEGA